MPANIAENLPHSPNQILVSFKDIGYYHCPENENHTAVISGQLYHWSVIMKNRKKIEYALG